MTRFAMLGLALLAACGGGGSDGADAGEGENGVVNLTGKVISGAGGAAGVTVAVPGHPEIITDSIGSFVIPGVQTPYSIVAMVDTRATVYHGLTRDDPTLELGVIGTQRGEISGGVSGGASYPLPANHTSRIHFVVPGLSWGGSAWDIPVASTGAYGPASLAWTGPGTVQVVMRAHQHAFDPVTNLPTTYTGYGTRTVTCSDGDTRANENVTLQPVNTDSLSGTFSIPPGYVQPGAGVSLHHGPFDSNLVFNDLNASPGAFSYNVPVVAGALLELGLFARSQDGTRLTSWRRIGLAPGTTDIAGAVQPAPALISPAINAIDVGHDTEFVAEAMADRAYVFSFSGGVVAIIVVTHETVARIPDLSAMGLALPSMTAMTVVLRSVGPVSSVNSVAGPGGLFLNGADAVSSSMLPRAFTTAP